MYCVIMLIQRASREICIRAENIIKTRDYSRNLRRRGVGCARERNCERLREGERETRVNIYRTRVTIRVSTRRTICYETNVQHQSAIENWRSSRRKRHRAHMYNSANAILPFEVSRAKYRNNNCRCGVYNRDRRTVNGGKTYFNQSSRELIPNGSTRDRERKDQGSIR